MINKKLLPHFLNSFKTLGQDTNVKDKEWLNNYKKSLLAVKSGTCIKKNGTENLKAFSYKCGEAYGIEEDSTYSFCVRQNAHIRKPQTSIMQQPLVIREGVKNEAIKFNNTNIK